MVSNGDYAYSVILIASLITLLFIVNGNTQQEKTDMLPLHVDGKDIKDSNGNIIILHGVVKTSMEDNADGNFYSNTLWDDTRVKKELDKIKETGANVIRVIFAINAWMDNIKDTSSAVSARTAMTRLAEFANEKGLYVIYCPWTVITGITNGIAAVQDPLPYPPGALSIGAGDYIANEADFTEFWGNVALTMKNYDNVLLEIWNEPQFGETAPAKAAWYTVVQNCINEIRRVGADNVILAPTNDWGRAYCDVGTDTAYVINTPTFTGGDIGLIVHLYRNDHLKKNGALAYLYADVDEGLNLMGYYTQAASRPVVITEVGCDLDHSPAEEKVFFAAALTLFNNHGISYTAFDYTTATSFYLLETEAPDYTLSDGGNLAIAAFDEIPSVTVEPAVGGSTDAGVEEIIITPATPTVTVEATPNTGYGFDHYEVETATATTTTQENPVTFTPTVDTTVTPVFTPSAVDPTDDNGVVVDGEMTAAYVDSAQADFSRADVYYPVADRALNKLAEYPITDYVEPAKNTGFEDTALTPWVSGSALTPATSASIDTTEMRTGGQCCKLTVESKGVYQVISPAISTNDVDELSVWVKGSNGDVVGLIVVYDDLSFSDYDLAVVNLTDSNYTEITATLDIDKKITYIEVNIGTLAGTAVYVDDLTFTTTIKKMPQLTAAFSKLSNI